MLASNLTGPTETRPVYTRRGDKVSIFPTSISHGVVCNYIRKPKKPQWAYTDVNGTALYNSGNSIHFELHESEETELVLKILQLSGVAIKDFNLTQAASQTEATITQQEKR